MKKVCMLLAFAGLSVAIFAQNDYYGYRSSAESDKYAVVTNSFGSNWFISAGGGAEALFGDDDWLGDFKDRISGTFNVAIGKWFTPALGLRLMYSGIQSRGLTRAQHNPFVKHRVDGENYYRQKFNYMNLHGDIMLNLNALFAGYDEKRVWEVIPYVGFGFTHTYSLPHRQALAINGGISNRFRLSEAWDFNIDINGMLTEDKFDAEVGGSKGYDGIVGLTAGFTYRFAKRGFKRPGTTRQLISEAELRQLRADMAALAAENASLQNQLANRPPTVEREVIVNKGGAPRAVFFNIDSSVISDRDMINLEYLAEEIKNNTNLRYKVVGYADSYTGNPTYNQGLSERRANAVADALAQKGVDRSRLDISGAGGVDLYAKPYLNRQVLIQPQ